MLIFLQVPLCFLTMGPRLSPSEGVHEPGYEARAARGTRRCHCIPGPRCQEMPVSCHASGSSGAQLLDMGGSRKDKGWVCQGSPCVQPPSPRPMDSPGSKGKKAGTY